MNNDIIEGGNINVYGARVHNLKNIDVEIPRNSLTVITGLSGSGKSSLAFDTIFAEGQRRYIDTFSAYARNFLGGMERPDVDEISGLSPVISIDQKTTNHNPRSTVGTTTEISDFLRLLFARAGKAYSTATGEEMVRHTEQQVVDMISRHYEGRDVALLAPLVRSRKGHYRELFDKMRRKGYLYVRIDGNITELQPGLLTDRYKNHDIEVVVDRLKVGQNNGDRLKRSIATAMKLGDGSVMVADKASGNTRYFSRRLSCPTTGIAYSDPAPNTFSFNSPQGACPRCKGMGYVYDIDIHKVIPDLGKSIRGGAITPLWKRRNMRLFSQMDALLKKYGASLDTPLDQLPDDAFRQLLYGASQPLRCGVYGTFDGVIDFLRGEMREISGSNDPSTAAESRWASQFLSRHECPKCHGMRLSAEALAYKIWDKNIAQLSAMDISALRSWIDEAEAHLDNRQHAIATEILKEIRSRLDFLLRVGLDYLSLDRPSESLSGGESQRIRLATQIGSQLVNVLYILDEPSIGLHQRDNMRLIDSLKSLRDNGNTVIVVEHDRDIMLAADYIVDIGPKAGRKGGEVVYQGAPKEMLRQSTITSQYLNGTLKIDIPATRRKGNGKSIVIHGARGNNLKNIDVAFPLGCLIVVTGVSGSGKSSLVGDTLQPILSQHFYRSLLPPLPYDSVEGMEHIDKVVTVDQQPIGRTPRSNPATYTEVFSAIRSLFVNLPEAKIRGYKPGRFSFNVKGGRCEACQGNGYKTVEMNFLPDVSVPCEVCHGKRYNRETLEVRFKGKSIADVLDMTINQAVEFFANIPDILRKIKTMQDVGLGYIKLGQPSTTLSGGESQRVKLAAELSKKDTGKTLYILDEPTTGLHFEDIRILMGVLNKLVDKGNTVVVIEHNIDVIKLADYIIDMGPEGGAKGGHVLAAGSPEQVALCNEGYTPAFLKQALKE